MLTRKMAVKADVVVVSMLFDPSHSMSCEIASGESSKTNKELGDTVGRVGVSRSHSSSAGTTAEHVEDHTTTAENKRRNTRAEASS